MVKRKIINKIKNNVLMYKIYVRVFQITLRVLSLFCPVNEDKIFFVSFNGIRFDDSPKSIYEAMLNMKQFDKYDFVWALRENVTADLPKGRRVNFDSFRYYYEALTSGLWITNVAVERGLRFKRKKTFYVNTWHGTPIKKLDQNIHKMNIDVLCAQSEYDAEIFKEYFELSNNEMLISGLPRNDELFRYTEEDIIEIKKALNIPLDKKIILYMPTYRRDDLNTQEELNVEKILNFNYWKSRLGDEYFLLLRMHYLLEKKLNIQENSFIKSVTQYSKCNDLYAISDVLVSDYSSAFFDYAILERPMISYAYDEEKYIDEVGMCISLEDLNITKCVNQEELFDCICGMNYDEEKKKTQIFKAKYSKDTGNATEKVIKCIIEKGGFGS